MVHKPTIVCVSYILLFIRDLNTRVIMLVFMYKYVQALRGLPDHKTQKNFVKKIASVLQYLCSVSTRCLLKCHPY